MSQQARSEPSRGPAGSDGAIDEAALTSRKPCGLLHDPGFRLRLEPAHREFLERYVQRYRQEGYARRHVVWRLEHDCSVRPDEIPWPKIGPLDDDSLVGACVRAVWPMVREGNVDQSELHILVRNGGCLDEEPEGVDVALIGPDEDEGVIVEFLPMEGVDHETAEGYKRHTAGIISSYADRETHPWRNVHRFCWSTSNAYGPLRFNVRLGKRPVQHWPAVGRRTTEMVAKQPPCVEGIGAVGPFRVYDATEHVGIELARREASVEGRVVWLREESVTVELTAPYHGGYVCKTISQLDEKVPLVDENGYLNQCGLQVVVELLSEMYDAAVAMEERLTDIRSAIDSAYESFGLERARLAPTVDARLRAIWRAMPYPSFDFDIAFFKSVLHAWGTNNAECFDEPVWWVR